MRNENGYIGFNLLVGVGFLVAAYFTEPLYAVLGVLVMAAAFIISLIMKVEDRKQSEALQELGLQERDLTEAIAKYAAK